MIADIRLDPSCSIIEVPVAQEIFKVRVWGDRAKARAIALLVHGLGAHSSWFEAGARELVRQGFLVMAYDQRGFGTRQSSPFHSYKEWIDDLVAITRKLKADYESLPFYLMGNSMGGLVAMASCRFVQIDGIVIFSPGFDGHPDTFTFMYKLKSILSALLSPDTVVELPYGFDYAVRDEKARKWLDEDPLKRTAVPGYILMELLKLSQNVLANLKEIHLPLLMITAGQEKIVNNKVNEKLFGRLQAPKKKHVQIQEAWHDLMFDPLVDEVAGEISKWQKELSEICVKAV